MSSAVTIKEPKAHWGGTGNPPHYPGGGGDGRGGDGYPNYGERLRRYRLGLAVGIAPIIMLFVGLTSAYIVRQGLASWDNNTNAYVNDWLPVTLPTLILSINTLILLVSSLTMELARRQAARRAALAPVTSIPGIADDEAKGVPWLSITVVLGVGFLVGQLLAWKELSDFGFYIATNPSSSFFYLLTGMHAIHLAGGVLALIYAAVAVAWLNRPIEIKRIVVDVAAWYWHFMALLWLYVFALLEIAR